MEALSQHRDAPGAVRCLICLDKFCGQPVATPQQCEHLYCLTCITEWAKTTNCCPVDRLEFNMLYQRTCVGGGVQKIVPYKLSKPTGADTVPVENWFCLECSTESGHPNSGLSREESEIDEAEVMDLLAEASLASTRLRPSTTTKPTVYARRSARVRQQSGRRPAGLSQPVQHVPRYLLKLTCAADEDTKTNNLIPKKSHKQATCKRKRKHSRDQ